MSASFGGDYPMTLAELPHFLEDVALARETYLKRQALAQRYAQKAAS